MYKITCPIHGIEVEALEGCPECLKEKELEAAQVNSPENIAKRVKEAEEKAADKEAKADDVVIPETKLDGEITHAEIANVTGPIGEFTPITENTLKDSIGSSDDNKTQDVSVAVIRIAPKDNIFVANIYAEGLTLRKYAMAAVIDSDEKVKAATNDLSMLSRLKKSMDEKRKEYLDPINQHAKTVREAFTELMAPFLDADKLYRNKIMAYRMEQEEKRRKQEEINRLQAELNQEPTQAVQEKAPERYRADVGMASSRKTRSWEIIDFSILPDEYKMPDASKIGKVVRAGIPSIPGVKITEGETLVIKADKGE